MRTLLTCLCSYDLVFGHTGSGQQDGSRRLSVSHLKVSKLVKSLAVSRAVLPPLPGSGDAMRASSFAASGAMAL